jgi:exoribonuclease R
MQERIIDKSTILEFFKTSPAKTIAEKDLLQRLHIESDHRHEFKKQLRELIASGEVIEVSKKRFALPDHVNFAGGICTSQPQRFCFCRLQT